MDTRTPQEIEEGITSTPTVAWDPFTVLPKEIYLEIFEKLDNATDKQNFMNSHRKFYDLFKAERVRFLFEKVIDDLPLDEEISNETDDDDSSAEGEFSNTDQHLTRLRLVCRDWNRGIQNYYQLHPDHFQFVFCEDAWKTNSKHLKQQYVSGYLFELKEIRTIPRSGLRIRPVQTDLARFMATHPPSKNPFLTRKISIVLDNSRHINEEILGVLWNQVGTLLETYGRHIWHFRFKDGFKLTPEMYSRIINWLQLMPELRTLGIGFSYWRHHKQNNVARDFANLLQIEAPEMQKLQNVYFSTLPTFAFNKLLEGMRAVEKLEVDVKYTDTCLRLRGYQLPTNLADAALTLTGNADFVHLSTMDPMPVLHKLIINLEFEYFQSRPHEVRGQKQLWTWAEWKTTWDTIAEKFPAVEDLHLSLPKAATPKEKTKALEQSLDYRLNMTKLKRLSLMVPNLFCLDFLQEMKGLRELKIYLKQFQGQFKGSEDLIRRETVHFNNREFDTMWESNIWELFPNLRKLCIHVVGSKGVIEVHSYEKGTGQERLYNKKIQKILFNIDLYWW